jgi:hypothetical protein
MTPCRVFGIIDRFQLQCHALPLHILLIWACLVGDSRGCLFWHHPPLLSLQCSILPRAPSPVSADDSVVVTNEDSSSKAMCRKATANLDSSCINKSAKSF